MKKITLTLLLMIGLIGLGFAQQFRGGMSDADREKLESAKIAFITNRLDLSADQAKEFWPIYNEYEKKKFETRTRLMREGYRMSNRGQNDLSAQQSEELIKMHLKSREEDLSNEKAYIEQLKGVITGRQILRLLSIDESFLRDYLMRQVRGDGPPESSGPRRGERSTGNN
jgi:hypothetical protein